jgi:ABC-type Fe3+-hydroxamate transport system substrate-binding protein
VALLCGVLAALAVGCGDRSNLIPQSRADDLTKQLADIKASVDQGECDGLADRVKTFHDDATNLSSSVDSRLRKRINDGVASLQDNAAKDCATARDAQTRTDTTTEPPADTTTTEPQTTETQTTATTTTPTDTTTTPDTPSTSTPGTPTTPDTPSTSTPPDTGGVTPGDGTATP